MDSENSDSNQFTTTTDAEREQIIKERSAQNTRNSTKTWISLFNKYVTLCKLGNNIDDISTEDLPTVLERFFSEVNKPNKACNAEPNKPPSPYKNSSMRVIRAGINRHVKETRGIDIMSDKRFIKTQNFFQGLMKKNKSRGYGSIKHKEAIISEDMEKLNDYFSQYMAPNPTILQRFK